MAKETTLNELGGMIEHLVSFLTENMATKEDIADIRRDMATKDQLFTLQSQVNSIETQIREMNHGKLEVRAGDLEEEVFGEIRS
jgi:hypothetical protein